MKETTRRHGALVFVWGAALVAVGCSKSIDVNQNATNTPPSEIVCPSGGSAPGSDGRSMVIAPLGSGQCFWIDADEVSVGSYAKFLAANLPPPAPRTLRAPPARALLRRHAPTRGA